jgi:hypothetical protein
MRAIFESGTKKDDVQNSNSKSKEDLQDERFMEKHKMFMAKTIEKIIKENSKEHRNFRVFKKVKGVDNSLKRGRSLTKLPEKRKSSPKCQNNLKLLKKS